MRLNDREQMTTFMTRFSEEKINMTRSLGYSAVGLETILSEAGQADMDGVYLKVVEINEYQDSATARTFYAVALHRHRLSERIMDHQGALNLRIQVLGALADKRVYAPDDVGQNIAVYTAEQEAKLHVRQDFRPLTQDDVNDAVIGVMTASIPAGQIEQEKVLYLSRSGS